MGLHLEFAYFERISATFKNSCGSYPAKISRIGHLSRGESSCLKHARAPVLIFIKGPK